MNKPKTLIKILCASFCAILILGLFSPLSADAAYVATTITFNACGGTVNKKSVYTTTVYNMSDYSAALYYTKATRTGCEFKGWYTAETGGTKVTSSKLVTKMYAQWKCLGHVKNPNPVIVKQPTETSAGKGKYVCKYCNATMSEYTIPKKAHTTHTKSIVKENGKIVINCSVCHEELSRISYTEFMKCCNSGQCKVLQSDYSNLTYWNKLTTNTERYIALWNMYYRQTSTTGHTFESLKQLINGKNESMNCAGYALGIPNVLYQQDLGVKSASNSIPDAIVAGVTEYFNKNKLNRTIREVKDPYDANDQFLKSNEYLIAIRGYWVDGLNFHCMIQLKDGTWAEKFDQEAPKILGYINPSDYPWDYDKYGCYKKYPTYYFAVTK